jgi:DNA repair exonuclease SbcCD nuclease subunit
VLIRADGCRLAFAGFPFAWSDLRQSFEGLVDSSGINETDADASFICIHHTVAGASVGPNGYTFRSGRDVIPRRHIASKLTAVFSGHIHRSQVLNGAHPPVYYPGSTERTSFAERDEQKGFYDLVISTDHSGAAKVAEATFVPLPSRPMLDLVLESAMTPRQAQSALSSAARNYPADAVVRITAEALGPELAELLSATRLRSIFPPTMNLQLSRSLFDVTR